MLWFVILLYNRVSVCDTDVSYITKTQLKSTQFSVPSNIFLPQSIEKVCYIYARSVYFRSAYAFHSLDLVLMGRISLIM